MQTPFYNHHKILSLKRQSAIALISRIHADKPQAALGVNNRGLITAIDKFISQLSRKGEQSGH